jgi:predicted lipid-binding transport protein (Tim44 family)
MKRTLFAAALSLVVALGAMPEWSEAKRFGGGKSFGMKRQAPAQTAPQTPPAQTPPTAAQAAPTAGQAAAPAAATATAAGKAGRSWLGPVAGLAAGLGLAALFTSLGWGEGLASFVTLLLLGVVAFVVIRLIVSRFAAGRSPALAGATAGSSAGAGAVWPQSSSSASREAPMARASVDVPASSSAAPAARSSGAQPAHEVSVTGAPLRPIRVGVAPMAADAVASAGAAPLSLPEGFDLSAFERAAKMIFIRLQAAHDSGDLDDLREFTTPEVFAAVRLDIQERNGAQQHTDVEQVDAELVGFGQESARHVASVRFKGLVREERDAPATAFDEVWHLVKPEDGSRNWAIAGIEQAQ